MHALHNCKEERCSLVCAQEGQEARMSSSCSNHGEGKKLPSPIMYEINVHVPIIACMRESFFCCCTHAFVCACAPLHACMDDRLTDQPGTHACDHAPAQHIHVYQIDFENRRRRKTPFQSSASCQNARPAWSWSG